MASSDATWHVYLLRCADDTLYCGVTTDLDRRLAQHNGRLAGGARYTRPRRPVALLLSRACTSRQEALRLKAAYRDEIPLYYGLEFDLVSQIPLDGYEYIIGSVHHIPVDGSWVSVDDAVEVTRHNVQDLFHGDSDAYSAAYYRQLLRVAGYRRPF